MAYFLGIDGGATKTTCAIADEQAVLATVKAGGCNVAKLGAEVARGNLQTSIREACRAAGVSESEIAATCIGAAGIAAHSAREVLAAAARDLVSGKLRIVGDMEIAMYAAFADGPGVIVIAGTGSIAFGRNDRGEEVRAGGWGWAISDEGSGGWIGRQAIATMMRAIDGGKSTALESLILRAWQCGARDELVKKANAQPQPDFAPLVPVVLRAEQEGDSAATDVLNRAGAELADLAEIVVRRLWLGGGVVEVATIGGVFANALRVRTSFTDELRRRFRDGVEVRSEVVEPVQGAVAMARAMGEGR